MRKEINGLATIVDLSFKLDPFGDAVFVFCNRSQDRLKILEWDGDGFWLHLKRLGKGRFKWPSKDKDGTMSLSGEELEHFFLLVFYAAPQALNENIIHAAALAVHAYLHSVAFQNTGELVVRELRTLVAVEYLRRSIFLNSMNTSHQVEQVRRTE
jgi:hypothetical protein